MRNITGNPVSGDDFFGRLDALQLLRRTVENGNHVLILAPRRVGKSSVIAELQRLLSDDSWKIVSVDVQHADDEAAFLQLIHEAIDESDVDLDQTMLERMKDGIRLFREMLRGVKAGAAGMALEVAAIEAAWEEAAAPLRKQIGRLARPECKILIAMDELPIFLSRLKMKNDGAERVVRILNWLRSVRQKCGTHLPWVLCGSIGLDTFVQREGLEGTINDLTEMTIGSLSRDDASELLQKLSESGPILKRLPDPVVDRILNTVGWLLPYYIQLMFHHLTAIPPAQRSSEYPSVSDVQTAYEAATRTGNLGHWASRLNDLLTADEKRRAHLILSAVAASGSGLNRDDLLGRLVSAAPNADSGILQDSLQGLLRLLTADGYLTEEEDRIRFRSFLLRDWWKREYPE